MKLLYIGSICADEQFDRTIIHSKIKPSSAPQHFESAILKGLSSIQEVDLTCLSTECIATYPNGYKLYLENRVDKLLCGVQTEIIPAVNLPYIKSFMHSRGVASKIKKWILENKLVKEKCVFLYGVYPSVLRESIKICKQYGCKCFVMVTDIPSLALTEYKGVKEMLKARERKKSAEIQGMADGYVYITKQMSDVVAPDKPFHVMEVLVDPDIVSDVMTIQKHKAIMYAGTLYKKYGIDKILEVYEKLNTDYELWIMGAGDYEDEIKQMAINNPKIKYFGVVSREEVLKREQEASLLINIRDPKDEYTKFSFPSKMIEYMLSGTPVITTKLPGFPQEYDNYLFYCEKYEVDSIVEKIKEILSLPSQTLTKKGREASFFVRENKNCTTQMRKVVDFILTQL